MHFVKEEDTVIGQQFKIDISLILFKEKKLELSLVLKELLVTVRVLVRTKRDHFPSITLYKGREMILSLRYCTLFRS